jgi:hypothetical protein
MLSSTLDKAHTDERTQGDTLLRRATSIRTLISSIVSMIGAKSDTTVPEPAERIRKELTGLAHADPDTCCTFIRCLRETICAVPPDMNPDLGPQLLSYVHELIIDAEDQEVVSESQATLAECLGTEETREEFFQYLSKADTFKSIETLQEYCLNGSPSNMQTALHLLGYFLDFAFYAYPSRRADCVRHGVHYIRTLRMTMIDTNVSYPRQLV